MLVLKHLLKLKMIKKNRKRFLLGKVVFNKMNKTISVLVKRYVKHKLYGKIIIKFKKYFVHNEKNIINIGDIVEICECRPISKKKHWLIKRIL